MKCGDFKRLINEQFDARQATSADVDRAWETHGSACPKCRAEALRYQALRRAIAALGTTPAPPADFADRFLREWEHAGSAFAPARSRRILRSWPAALPLAAAAALLLAFLAGLRARSPAKPANEPPRVAVAIDPDALSDALAEATSATWELARATSAPAARVGLGVLDTGVLSETTASPSTGVGPASEGSEGADERVQDGDRPLSGTARHAFGFLFGPVRSRPEASPTSSRGA
jgi:hypothetical protein